MRISRGRRGNSERFKQLEQWTARKRKGKPSSAGATDAPLEQIFISQSPGLSEPSDPSLRAEAESETPLAPLRSASAGEEPGPPAQPAKEPARPAKAASASPAKQRVESSQPPGPPPGEEAPFHPKRHPIRRLFRYAFLALLVVATLAFGAALQWLRVYLKELPPEQGLERYRPMLISRLYSGEHQLIGEYIRERRKLISIEEVPRHLIQAIVAREDKNFFKHYGVDPEGIARAVYTNLKAKRLTKEGASTLTMQLVKNLTNQREKIYSRKIKEMLLALKVEQTYSKEEILEMYLNQVYWGHGCYGIGAAAELYFGKEVKDLNLNESAMLAGLIQLPERYTPFRNPERASSRRTSVLHNMYDLGYITEKQYRETAEEPLRLASRDRRRTQKNLAPHFYEYVRLSLGQGDRSEGGDRSLLPYPLESAAVSRIGQNKLYSDGLSIETTLHFALQRIADEAVRQGLHRVEQMRRKYPSYWGEPADRIKRQAVLKPGEVYDARIVRRLSEGEVEVELPDVPAAAETYRVAIDPETTWLDDFGVLDAGYWLQVEASKTPEGGWSFAPAPESHVQGCLVALEAETGKILALVGGYDFFEDHPGAKIIFPVQAALQPGSCFKPILYAYAFSRGMTPSDRVVELPLQYRFNEQDWHISNFESTAWNPELHGETPLRRALVKSMNVASVHLWNAVTRDNHLASVTRFARESMGLQSPVRPERASALGVSELYPIELAAAFAAFANGGRRIRPYAIERVTDHYGNILALQYPVSEPILRDPKQSAQVAYQITHILEAVLRDAEGTGYRTMQELYPGGFLYPVAGKTGTTNDCTDAWFCGYNPHIVTCVWVGFERKKSLGDSMTGSKAALPIWAAFMEQAIPAYYQSRPLEEERGKPPEAFPIPPGMTFVEICKKSGRLANDYCRRAGRSVAETFIAGTEPREACTYHGPGDMDAFDRFIDELIVSDGGAAARLF